MSTRTADQAAAKLRADVARARRDRPHQTDDPRMVIGARLADLQALLDDRDACRATHPHDLDLDADQPQQADA